MTMLLSTAFHLLTAATTSVEPSAPALPTFHGKGVHYAEAKVGCLLKTPLGSRGERACLRIALYDDKSTVEIDTEKHRIVVRNTVKYDDKTLVADILLPGWSTVASGRVAAAAHLLVRKDGKTFTGKFHAHAMSREKPQSVELEDYEVSASDGKNETVVMSTEAARKAVLDPGLAAKMVGELVEVQDNLEGATASEGKPLPAGDITVALGIGRAAKDVLRAQLFHTGGDFELRLTALSSLIPKDVISREMMLYGVDELPNLAELKKRGLKSGETVTLTVRDGKGVAKFKESSAEFPNAAEAIRGFFEGNFMGALLAHQAHLDAAK